MFLPPEFKEARSMEYFPADDHATSHRFIPKARADSYVPIVVPIAPIYFGNARRESFRHVRSFASI